MAAVVSNSNITIPPAVQRSHGSGHDRGAEARGQLPPGMRVVEYTGGSTESAGLLVMRIKWLPVARVVDAFCPGKAADMRLFGADLQIVSFGKRKAHPELFRT